MIKSYWKVAVPTILGLLLVTNAISTLSYVIAGFLFIDAGWELMKL